MEILKAREFPRSQDPPSQLTSLQQELFGQKNLEIFELQKVVQNGDVESFLDVLERLSSEKQLSLSAIFDQVTVAGDSLLHEAAYFGKLEIAELIGHHFPNLVTKTNMKGDIPLHVAARERSVGVIMLILSHYATHRSTSSIENNRDGEITRMTNEYGNIALHEAVGSKHIEGATLLFEADKCMTHYLNKSYQSPLYLAVLSSNKDMVNILLEAPFLDDDPLPKHHGNSPLHVAIYTKNADLVKEIVEKRVDLMFLKDEDGETPLHYAAATGYANIVHMLIKKSILTALEWNLKGHLPIHLACKFGHIEVLKEFLQQEWVDPRVLLNKEGQNILHVAAGNGQENVVQYLLKNTKFKKLDINEKDKNGDTPLHLAAKNLHRSILFSLTEEKSIDVNLTNNEGLTAIDTSMLKCNTPMTTRQLACDMILISAGAQMTGKGKKLLSESKDRIIDIEEGLKNRMNTLMIVAILIVTVTFAAGFTIPGGSHSSDDPNPRKRGMPVFGNKFKFWSFIAFNTLAMYSSAFGATLLLCAQLCGDTDMGLVLFLIALFVVTLALLFMVSSFTSAVFLIVSDICWLDALVDVFVPLFFLVLLLCMVSGFVLGRFTISVYWALLLFRRLLVLPRKIN